MKRVPDIMSWLHLLFFVFAWESQFHISNSLRVGKQCRVGCRWSSPSNTFKTSHELGAFPDYLNTNEYPDDDYSHILGFFDDFHKPSKLQEISRLRLADTELSKKPIDTQGCGIDRSFYVSHEDLENDIEAFDAIYGKPLNLFNRIKSTYPTMAIAAEFKKASPSKGDINPNLDPVEQCLAYAQVGASVISVLTEFRHFKGTLSDLKRVRIAIQKNTPHLEQRPAILRKDFILDRYQILEARSHGADTILLIVAILGVSQLRDLMSFSRSLGMEPLVEVHTEREIEIAIDCGARVVGVNNRNLHTFQLDLETTNRAISVVEHQGLTWALTSKSSDVTVCTAKDGSPDMLIAALSGITCSEDVDNYRRIGVSCCLVGETLMKSQDPKETIKQLLSGGGGGNANDETVDFKRAVLVKMCGFTEECDVQHALQSGANLIGLIFAESSKRKVSMDNARRIVDCVRRYGERSEAIRLQTEMDAALEYAEKIGAGGEGKQAQAWFTRMSEVLTKVTLRQPLSVGVFQDQSVEEINEIISTTGIDLVQLHGDESQELISQIHAPCLKVIHIPVVTPAAVSEEVIVQMRSFAGKAIGILLDSKSSAGTSSKRGGTGESFDHGIISLLQGFPVILAGGLTVDNVAEVFSERGHGHTGVVVGVDVAGGIEYAGSPGKKNPDLVKTFIARARE